MRRLVPAAISAALLLPALVPSPAVADGEASPEIPAAIAASYDGGDLRVGRALATTSAYTRHAITYRSGDLTITGTMTRPRGKGPFPVVVLAHGHIEPSAYQTGQGFIREQDWLGRHGYIALHVDYRNHAGSDDDPGNELSMRIGYAADIVNAGLAVRRTLLPYIDNTRVALLGRSMGGGVTFQTLVIRPGLFDAAAVYASTSSRIADNFNAFQRDDALLSKQIIGRYGTPKNNPDQWDLMSSQRYFSRITEPVLMIHGTRDETCPISWAYATRDALVRAGKSVSFVEYPNAGHYMYAEWPDSIKQVKRFLARYLEPA